MNPLTETNAMATSILQAVHNRMVTGSLLYRDYDSTADATYGDMINVRLNGNKFHCPLTGWTTASFLMEYGERSKSYANLCNTYFEPCGIAMAEAIDRSALFWMAVRAGTRIGTPGRGMVAGAISSLGTQNLVVGSAAQAQLLESGAVIENKKMGDEGTALRDASVGRVSGTQIWLDQTCPPVTTDEGVAAYKSDDVYEVLTRQEIGEMSIGFGGMSAAVGCRDLPIEGSQQRSYFGGLSLRVTHSKPDPENVPEPGKEYDRFTIDMLTGIGVDPKETTVIYS